jgi:RNA polymerase sigma factor (sigma-70 family)
VFSWLVGKVNTSAFVDMDHLEARATIKARSLAIDYIRHESRSPVVNSGNDDNQADRSASQEPNPAEELEEREFADLLLNVRKLLDLSGSKQFAVLKCLFLEERTQQETASILSLSVKEIGSHRARGLEKIKKEISRHQLLMESLTFKYPKLQLTLEIAFLALLIK